MIGKSLMVPGAMSNSASGCYINFGADSSDWEFGQAFQLKFAADNNIYARDGSTVEDTGFDWISGQWVGVTALLDVGTKTYELWIDGTKYHAPDDLNFRAPVDFVDDVMSHWSMFGDDTTTGPHFYVDNVSVWVPEPHSVVLLASGLGILGVLLVRRRRR